MKRLILIAILLLAAMPCLVWADDAGVGGEAPKPGQLMKDGKLLRKNILNASTNALDENEAKWIKEFEKEAKKGILVDIFVPQNDDDTMGEPVFIKFKLHKGDRYYYYADKKAQGAADDAQKGYEKVAKYQKAKEAAQVLVSELGANNVPAVGEDRTLTYVERKTVNDNKGEHNVIRLIYRDSRGTYFYEDVKIDDGDIVKVNDKDIPAADLMVALKKIAQKGLDAVASGKKMRKKLPVDKLLGAYEKKLGIFEGFNCKGDSNETCRLVWRYVHDGVAYRISHLVEDLTVSEYNNELDPLDAKGKEKIKKIVDDFKKANKSMTSADVRNLAKVEVVPNGKGEGDLAGWYSVHLIFDDESDDATGLSSSDFTVTEEELAELRALARVNNPNENVVSEDEKQEALAAWEQNYRELLNDLYMKEMFVKTYNPVFDWQEIELAEPSKAWFEDAAGE